MASQIPISIVGTPVPVLHDGTTPSRRAGPQRGRPGLKILGQADEEAATRAELRRTDADPMAVADLIFVVADVDHVEANLDPGLGDAVARGQVELGVGLE